MKESTEAVIRNNNQLLDQVAGLMSKYDSADSKAAIGECLAAIINANNSAVAESLEASLKKVGM